MGDLTLEALAERVQGLKEQCANFITRAEFDPVKIIVYGVSGLILAGVFGAIIALVIRK